MSPIGTKSIPLNWKEVRKRHHEPIQFQPRIFLFVPYISQNWGPVVAILNWGP